MKGILLPIFILFLFAACNNTPVDPGEEGIKDFGYKTLYKGHTFSAIYNSYDDSQKMALKLIEAIDNASKLYRNASSFLLPDAVVEDEALLGDRIIAYSDCDISFGELGYDIYNFISGSVVDNSSFLSNIDFNKYCRKTDGGNPQRIGDRTVLNGSFLLTENYSSNVEGINIWHKHAVADNLTVDMRSMKNGKEEWDNISIYGYIAKSREGRLKSSNFTFDNTTLALDKPRPLLSTINPDDPTTYEADYRFDLFAEEIPNKSLIIRFFYKDYGYIISDISFLVGAETIPPSQRIMMKYRDKECSFTLEEIEEKKFNCGDY